MSSNFPAALDNIAADKTDTTTAAGDHAPHHNALADAINAVQTALGVNLANVATAAQGALAETALQPGDGSDGASAYEVAVANGFVGTEAQWLASLVGPQGAAGPQGPQGETGPAGPQGPAGTTSFAGLTDVPPLVQSQTTGITGADQITNIVSLTQAEYDAITPNAATLYVIAG